MFNPPPDTLRRFMAELMGGYCLCAEYYFTLDKYNDPEPNCPQCDLLLNPDWLNDRNASYDLPVENQWNYAEALSQLILSMPDEDRPIWGAYTESLAWILYKGYKWDNKKEEFLHD